MGEPFYKHQPSHPVGTFRTGIEICVEAEVFSRWTHHATTEQGQNAKNLMTKRDVSAGVP